MKAEELSLINSMIDIVKEKVPNLEFQKYVETHLCKLLNNNNQINDLTTGVEICEENEKGIIEEHFKIIFYPKKHDFNFKDFDRIDTVYQISGSKKETKVIKFEGNLIELTEVECNHSIKGSFNTTQIVRKRKYLDNNLVHNYQLFSKISSDFLIQSYTIEEETFINDNSVTRSILVAPKHASVEALKGDISKTDTILARYIDEKYDLNNVTFINSDYLVGEKFNTQKKKEKDDYTPLFRPTTGDVYKKMEYKYAQKNI